MSRIRPDQMSRIRPDQMSRIRPDQMGSNRPDQMGRICSDIVMTEGLIAQSSVPTVTGA